MNDQNQNHTKPDYGFILNQQVPAAKPKRDKKVLVLVVACSLLAVVAGAAFVLNTANNKVATNGSQVTAESHLKKLADGNITGAYGEMSSATKSTSTQADYSKNVAGVLTGAIDLSSCKISTTKQATDAKYFSCNTKNKQMVVTLKVVTTTENSKTRIVRYLVVDAEKIS